MLAVDASRGHLSHRIKNRLRNKNIYLVIIFSSRRIQLQQLDVSNNKPLKHLACKASSNKDNHILAPTDKIKRASASIVEWISDAWKEVPITIIPKSFLKCCWRNVEDAMQDDILWDDSEQSGEGASSENESATD
jgi:hypothetical protein